MRRRFPRPLVRFTFAIPQSLPPALHNLAASRAFVLLKIDEVNPFGTSFVDRHRFIKSRFVNQISAGVPKGFHAARLKPGLAVAEPWFHVTTALEFRAFKASPP